VAHYGGETATIATLTVGYRDSQSTDSTVRCGPGVTLTTLNQSGGSTELNAGLTTVTKTGGTLTINAGNVTTLTDDGGVTYYLGTGTIGTLNTGHLATVDFAKDMRVRTVTNSNWHKGCTINDPFATVAWTNPPRLVRATLRDVNVDVGFNRTYGIA
jgi:hypothetical protein